MRSYYNYRLITDMILASNTFLFTFSLGNMKKLPKGQFTHLSNIVLIKEKLVIPREEINPVVDKTACANYEHCPMTQTRRVK